MPSMSKFHGGTEPAGRGDFHLPYDRLSPDRFAEFCQKLIEKKFVGRSEEYSVQVREIGHQGKEQGGADFLVINRSGYQRYHLLYEVKRVSRFNVSLYKNTINRFLNRREEWGVKISAFHIMLSEQIDKKLLVAYEKYRKILIELNIEHELIDRSVINQWMQDVSSPELLAEFFGEQWVERFYGKSALWHLEQGGIYGFKDSDGWLNYKGREESLSGNIYSLINDHARIQVFLPEAGKDSLSCFIGLRHRDYQGIVLTLSQRFLLKNLFEGVNTPVEAESRPWILAHYEHDGYYCDLENCRLNVSLDAAMALCDVFDSLWKQYKKRMEEIERIYRSTDFSLRNYARDDIPLLRIPLWLWYRVEQFCEHHDYLDTQDKWSIFNPLSNKIMVMNDRRSDAFSGTRVEIKARRYPDFYSLYNNDVVLLWQVPSRDFYREPLDKIIHPRQYCDALTTYYWLKDELLPTAYKWYERRQKKPGFSFFIRKVIKELDPELIFSYYSPVGYSNAENMGGKIELLDLLKSLQYFYHSCTQYISFHRRDIQALCSAFQMILAQCEVHYWGYICGSVGATGGNRDSVEAALQNLVKVGPDDDNRISLVDHLFRGMIALYRDGKCHLNDVEVSNIARLLEPFVHVMEDRSFLRRRQLII